MIEEQTLKEAALLAAFIEDFWATTPKSWQKHSPPDWLFRFGLTMIQQGWCKRTPSLRTQRKEKA